jgi:hypothetical protein
MLLFQLFMDNLFGNCSFDSISFVTILFDMLLKLLFKLIKGFSYN